jgi:hypothetical protein
MSSEYKKQFLADAEFKLNEHKIPFQKMPNGIHLKISTLEGIIDFWPSTGRYSKNGKKSEPGGINKILELCVPGTQEIKENSTEKSPDPLINKIDILISEIQKNTTAINALSKAINSA